MAILLSDDFNRADNASTVGNPQIGPAPVALGGAVFGISANKLYSPNPGGLLSWEVGTKLVKLTAKVSTNHESNSVGATLALCAVDHNNFYQAEFSAAHCALRRMVQGSWQEIYLTTRADARLTWNPVTLTPVGFSYDGKVFRVTVNGNLIFRHCDEAISSTATKVGVRSSHGQHIFHDDVVAEDFPYVPDPPTNGVLVKGRDSKTLDMEAGA